jgi:hypothetical protein
MDQLRTILAQYEVHYTDDAPIPAATSTCPGPASLPPTSPGRLFQAPISLSKVDVTAQDQRAAGPSRTALVVRPGHLEPVGNSALLRVVCGPGYFDSNSLVLSRSRSAAVPMLTKALPRSNHAEPSAGGQGLAAVCPSARRPIARLTSPPVWYYVPFTICRVGTSGGYGRRFGWCRRCPRACWGTNHVGT